MNRHSKQCSPHEDYHGTKNEESKIEIVTICIFWDFDTEGLRFSTKMYYLQIQLSLNPNLMDTLT